MRPFLWADFFAFPPCTLAVGCRKLVQYICMLSPRRFIFVESVTFAKAPFNLGNVVKSFIHYSRYSKKLILSQRYSTQVLFIEIIDKVSCLNNYIVFFFLFWYINFFIINFSTILLFLFCIDLKRSKKLLNYQTKVLKNI